jgi:hypothetical protein
VSRASQNGWPVVGKSACDQGPFHGVRFPNGILAGDVAIIARWQLRRYVTEVEPIHAGSCWGWYVKTIEGSSTISNHASATAWDVNAPQHPMGRPASASMTGGMIAECRAIVRDSGGVLRWGGDFRGRPDPMHWEIIGTRAEAHTLAMKIVQRAYNRVPDTGADIAVDGSYGPLTTAKAKRVQKHFGIAQTGKIDSATLGKIEGSL